MDDYTFEDDDFELVGDERNPFEEVDGNTINLWKDVWSRLKRNNSAIFGMSCILVILVMAIIGPLANDYDYQQENLKHTTMPPRVLGLDGLDIFDGMRNEVNVYEQKDAADVYYWFGTDDLGRDLWTRCWEGTRVSLLIVGVVVITDIIIGILYGLISGYFGGIIDRSMQYFIKVVYGIPSILIVSILIILLQSSLITITLALLMCGWVEISKTTRNQVLKLKQQEFIIASRTLGRKSFAIMVKDILPNIWGQTIIIALLAISNILFTETFLAFIGLGVSPRTVSLGVLISEGSKSMQVAPYMLFIPMIILVVLLLSFNLLAAALREALDASKKEV